jgi:UDP-N-acetylmuramate--alanine ligase
VAAVTAGQLSGRRLHFVGIGGAGISGLALVARALGAEVTGSDRVDSPYCEHLRDEGIEPAIGHDAANLPEDVDEVVVSTAIPDDNAEVVAARQRGAPVRHRSELLAEVAGLKRSLAVAGAHGKTTTAAMAAHVLLELGLDPAFLIGGELRAEGTNARWGEGEWIVVEADESDRSFLRLPREVAVVTNVELDHHATYRSPLELEEAFGEFTAPASVRVLEQGLDLPGEGLAVTFGIGAGDLHADEVELRPGGSAFTVDGVPVELKVPGMHNVANAVAAMAACRAVGVEPRDAAAPLRSFAGASRRFEEHGVVGGTRIVDDYAHHPTELTATLEAARTLGPERLVACFQPHLYSRTGELFRAFGRALGLADLVVVVDVYPAREQAEEFPGISGLLVAQAAADHACGRPVWWIPSLDDAEERLRHELREGDLLLTLGAGDVDRVARGLVEREPTPASA